MKFLRPLLLAGTFTLLLNGQASGAEGLYVGGGFGPSRLRNGGTFCADQDPTFPCSLGTSDTEVHATVGYRFSDHIATELSFRTLGIYYAFVRAPSGSGGDEILDVSGPQVGVDVIGTWPVWRKLSVLGRVGIYRWDVVGNSPVFNSALGGFDGIRVTEKTGVSPDFGIGASYQITRRIDVRVEYTRFPGMVNPNTNNHFSVDTFTISAHFLFSKRR